MIVPVLVPPAATIKVPPPFTWSVSALVSIPLVSSRPDKATVPAEIVKLWMSSECPDAWLIVMLGVLMTASSFTPGKTPVLQLLAVSQSPPAGLIQEIVDGSVRFSSHSTHNRLPAVFLRRTSRTGKVAEYPRRARSDGSQEENRMVRNPYGRGGLRL